MNETSNKRAVAVGIFIIVGLVFLSAAVLVIGNLHETFSRKIRVVTVLDDVSGLQPGNNIWFSGVKIGTVKSIQFHGRSEVKVVMKIDRKVQQYIRRDARVKISTDGLIGNKIIVIYGGTPQGGMVSDGDTLGVEETLSTENMMSTLQASNKNLLEITNDIKSVTGKIARGEGSAGKLLNEEILYQKLENAAGALQATARNAENAVLSLNNITANLNKKGRLLYELGHDTVLYTSVSAAVTNLKLLSDSAAVVVNALKASGTGTKSVLGVLINDEESGRQVKNTIGKLESSSARLDENLEGLQHSFLLRKYFRKKKKSEDVKTKRAVVNAEK